MDRSDQRRRRTSPSGSRRHQAQLFGYIYSLVRDLDDADDLFQQTSLVLWDKFDQFDPSQELHRLGLRRGPVRGLELPPRRSRQRLYFSDELSLMLIDAHEELEQERRRGAARGPGRCLKKLRPRRPGACRRLLRARRRGSRRSPTRWGRSTQSIHNSLRRIRRTLFECVSRSLARGG